MDEAIERLKRGEVIGVPTDTVFGLAALSTSRDGIEKIFSMKRRSKEASLVLCVSSFAMAEHLVAGSTSLFKRLAMRFWPGPLTLIVPKSPFVDPLITGGRESVGVRMPAHSELLALIDAVQEPLVITSANLSGEVEAKSVSELDQRLGLSYLLVGESPKLGRASTIFSLIEGRILREGPLNSSDILSLLEDLQRP